jgi:hypothetical protein
VTPTLPRYGAASLSEVLPGALAALGLEVADPLGLAAGPLDGVRRLIVLLIDGLGWHQLPVAAPHAPTLTDLTTGRLGLARSITCGLPSTTPTSLVSVGAGVAPGVHGVLGFNVNVPGTDRILTHITWANDPDPAWWQPTPTMFTRAAQAGIATTVVSRSAFEGTGLTVSAYRGAAYRYAETPDELAPRLIEALADNQLVYGYCSDVDHAGHQYGVDSPLWRVAVGEVDRLITRLVDNLPGDAALIITADHGQLNVPPDARVDVDAEPGLRAGLALVAGEPRMRYLHTVPGARDDVMAAWRDLLGARVEVLTREDAVERNWFGPVPPQHLARIGDIVVAARDPFAVLASGSEPASVSRLVAFHGSYTALEMEIPLMVVRSVGGTR